MRKLKLSLTILVGLGLGVMLPAQESDAKKLDRLLRELQKIDSKQWQAKLEQLQVKAGRHRKRAVQMRKQAKDLEAAARKEDHKAVAVEAEIGRLQELMRVLAATAAQPTPKAMPKPKPAAQRKPARTPNPAPAKSKPKPKPTPKRKPAPRKLAAAGAPDAPATAPGAVAAASVLTYDDHILPIFEANCTACHDPSERKGGLDLTSYATAIRGGGSGKTIVPRDSEGSRLYMLVSHQEKPTMPPDEDPIGKAQIDRIRRWIAAGAPENRAAAMAARRRPVVKAPAPKAAKPRPAAKGPPPVPKNWPALAPAVPKRAVTIKTLAVSPRAPLLAVPGHQQVLVLHATTRKLLGVLPFPEGEVEVLRFSADGSRLLVAGGASGKRGRAHVYDVVTGKPVAQLGAEADAILAAAISPDNRRVALGGSGKRLRVYDVQGGSRVYEVKNHNEWVMSADFSADGKYLVSCDRKGEIVVTEAGRGRNLHVLRGHRGTVHAVRCSPSRQLVASVGEDGTLRLWQLRDGKQRWSRRASAQAVLAVAFGPKDVLASGGADGQVRTWNLAGRPRGALPANGDWVYALGFEARGQLLFTGDWQGRARVLDVRSRRRIASFVPSVGSGD